MAISNAGEAMPAGVEGSIERGAEVGEDPRVASVDPSKLFSLVYGELRTLAASWFRSQRANHTLQPTALVHEAFLKLASNGSRYYDRTHLLATVGRAMRQILVDYARGHDAIKRGGGRSRLQVENLDVMADHLGAAEDGESFDLELLHQALNKLEQLNRRQAEVVELRFFGGLTIEEAAQVLEVSSRTVKLDWQFARAWLLSELRGDLSP